MSFFPLKTDQNLAPDQNYVDKWRRRSWSSQFLNAWNFFGKLPKRLVNFGKYIGNILNFNKQWKQQP